MRAPGERLAASEHVHRRISRKMIHNDRPMSGALKPKKTDDGRTSVHDAGLISGADAAGLGIAKGEDVPMVVSFSVGQIEAAAAVEGKQVPVNYEPREDDRSHSLMDMRSCGSNQAERISAAVLAEGKYQVTWRTPE